MDRVYIKPSSYVILTCMRSQGLSPLSSLRIINSCSQSIFGKPEHHLQHLSLILYALARFTKLRESMNRSETNLDLGADAGIHLRFQKPRNWVILRADACSWWAWRCWQLRLRTLNVSIYFNSD